MKTIEKGWSWRAMGHLGKHITHLLPVTQIYHSKFLAGSSRSLTFYGSQSSACMKLCWNTLFSGDSSDKVTQESRSGKFFSRCTIHQNGNQEQRLNWFTCLFLAKGVQEQNVSLYWREFIQIDCTKFELRVTWIYTTEDGVSPFLVLLNKWWTSTDVCVLPTQHSQPVLPKDLNCE